MTSLIAFLILIGVLITAHEFGHFIVAKICGVKVHTFSVGFGRAILSKTIGETEYRIALLPLGGYVRLHGMEREFGEEESAIDHLGHDLESDDPDRGRALQDKPAWMRVLIFVAGPAMNLLLPFALLPPLFFSASQYDEVIDTHMGAVDEGLPAYQAGLRDGDRITHIDGDPVYSFWQIQHRVNDYQEGAAPLRVEVERPHVTDPLRVDLTPERVASTERFAGFDRRPPRIGFQPASLSADYAIIDPQGLFAQAGGRSFDRVIAVNDHPIQRHSEVIGEIAKALKRDETITLKIERLTPIDKRFNFLRHKTIQELTLSQKGQKQRDELIALHSRGDDLDYMERTLRLLGIRQAGACISSIDPESAAAKVLKIGDCLLEVDGARHSLAVFFEQRLRYHPEAPKRLKILRNGEEIMSELSLRQEEHSDPLAGDIKFWQLGFTLSGLSKVEAMISPTTVKNDQRMSFSWTQAKRRVSDELTRSVHSLSGLFSGQVSPTQLSGPITIFYLAGQQAEAGWIPFVNLMVLISLSIALLNLLPIPGLDGGHILFASLEMVSGRPLSPRIKAYIQTTGVLLILCLILFALGNDMLRMWRISQGG